jgi:multidrug resistance efflux pump
MELILLLIYSFFVWLIFFKFKLLPWNIVSQVIVFTLPVLALIAIILTLNLVAPSTNDVRAINHVIPIVPRVSGQVTEVPIQPNQPVKKGDVLFRIDPTPFELDLKAAEATLESLKVGLITAEAGQRGLEDQLRNATAKKAAVTAQLELARKRADQFTQLAQAGASRGADLDQALSEVARLESEFLAAEASESQVRQKLSARDANGEIDEVAAAKARIAKAESDVQSARYDLEGTTHLAPADGRVVNLALRPGARAVQMPMSPVMSFVEDSDQWVVALFRQNELLNVQPGDEAEIYLRTHPGRIIKCTVDSILWATAQGQLPISGNLPNTAPAPTPEQRIAVRLLVQERDRDLFLAAGARGSGAIFTQHGAILHVIRKVMLRVSTKLDWLVLKLH